MKALILAAGKGERFYPFNAFRPKPMFPICNRPLLEWLIVRIVGPCALVGAGVVLMKNVPAHKAVLLKQQLDEIDWSPHIYDR